jgi:1-acyl-sn-glycerol-3-phosphate acyltransferase
VTRPPFNWWRTVFVSIPLVTIYTIVCGAVSLASTLVDRRGFFAHRVARLWGWLILRTTGVTVERSGAPLPPPDQSCIFVANHSSHYDTPILFTALPRQLRTMAKANLGRVPFVGWHLRLAGHLLVDRASPGAAIFKRMQRMTKQGASLYVFPEGSRSSDGHVGRFKGGIFLLAIETKLPVVPVSVRGSRAVMPKGRLTVDPGRVDVIVHEPIVTAAMTRDDARGLATRVQAIVAADVEARSGAAS